MRLEPQLPRLAAVARNREHDVAAGAAVGLARILAHRIVARPNRVQISEVRVERRAIWQVAMCVDRQIGHDVERHPVSVHRTVEEAMLTGSSHSSPPLSLALTKMPLFADMPNERNARAHRRATRIGDRRLGTQKRRGHVADIDAVLHSGLI